MGKVGPDVATSILVGRSHVFSQHPVSVHATEHVSKLALLSFSLGLGELYT